MLPGRGIFAKSIQVISSIVIQVLLFFEFYLAEDFFFAKSIQVISSNGIQVFFVFWCCLAEDFFFAKSIQVISSFLLVLPYRGLRLCQK